LAVNRDDDFRMRHAVLTLALDALAVRKSDDMLVAGRLRAPIGGFHLSHRRLNLPFITRLIRSAADRL